MQDIGCYCMILICDAFSKFSFDIPNFTYFVKTFQSLSHETKEIVSTIFKAFPTELHPIITQEQNKVQCKKFAIIKDLKTKRLQIGFDI